MILKSKELVTTDIHTQRQAEPLGNELDHWIQWLPGTFRQFHVWGLFIWAIQCLFSSLMCKCCRMCNSGIASNSLELFAITLSQWSTEYGPRTSSISITWELVRLADFQTPPQVYQERNSGCGAQQSTVKQALQGILFVMWEPCIAYSWKS